MRSLGKFAKIMSLAMAALIGGSLLLGAQDDAPEAKALKSLEWRPIGPANMGGRVSDIVGIPGDPKTFYVGGADGGVWKTTNAGTTFEPLFEDQPVYSIGSLTLAPSDLNILWLGSGEGDPRNSVSYGNGVYLSTDAGKHWKHLGLEDTERIHRIVVHPQDPNTALVCAMGHEWGPNEERGVFKTTDAGETWEKVLYIDEDTGCSDLAMDLSNPRYLYAGMWTFRRKPWRFDSGGAETALYKSVDGGKTWTKKTKGLPKGPMDRIGALHRAEQTPYRLPRNGSERRRNLVPFERLRRVVAHGQRRRQYQLPTLLLQRHPRRPEQPRGGLLTLGRTVQVHRWRQKLRPNR